MSGAEKTPHLSGRLSVIADCVRMCAKAYPEKPRMADIGCDHALIPVTLLLGGDVAFAYASDVRKGPLRAARENAARFGTEDHMRFVLADGLSGIGTNEADLCVIAGMGGELVRDILEAGDAPAKGISALVLSPHTKQEALRAYLADSAYRIVAETVTEEDSKYYPVITACTETAGCAGAFSPRKTLFPETAEALFGYTGCDKRDALQLCMQCGPLLLKERNPVLKDVLIRRQKRLAGILDRVSGGNAPEEVTEQMRLTTYALKWFDGGERE